MSNYTEMGVGRCTVVGMSGKARSGKSYLALNGLRPLGYLPLSLAMAFKAEAVARHDLPIREVMGDLPKSDETRHILQQMGTEQGRMVYGEDIWTTTLTVWMRWFFDHGYRNFVITDVRFPNEAEWVKSFRPGARLIRVEGRGGAESAAAREHISETALDEWTAWDMVIDNSPEQGPIAPVQLLKHVGGLWIT